MYKYEDYQKSAKYIKEIMGERKPKTAIILGSGLGVISDDIDDKIIIKYKDIPNFPISTAFGHAGELIIGKIKGKEVIVMNGRFHYYEGYDLKQTTFPIRVFKLLGIENLVITNAAGGINKEYNPGEFVVINDYLSFFAESVLRGANLEEFGTRFPGMNNAFDKELSNILKEVIKEKTGFAHEGVYAYMKGPSFESPAEIRALRTMGADVVGMSTVPEVVVATHCGIKCVGVSCVTNMAAGVLDEELSHEDVINTGEKVKYIFKDLIKEFIEKI